MNSILLVGRISQPPELKYSQKETPYCKLRIAVKRYGTSEDTNFEDTDFFNIVCWGERGEHAAQFLRVGRMVSIRGKLRNRRWMGKSGQWEYTQEIIAEEIEYLQQAPREDKEESRKEKNSEEEIPGCEEYEDYPF